MVEFRKLDGTTLAPQKVRLEYEKAMRLAESPGGQAAERRLVIIGVRDHPTVPNTDIGRGYRFVFQDRQYTVLDPVVTPGGGEVQAYAEAIG